MNQKILLIILALNISRKLKPVESKINTFNCIHKVTKVNEEENSVSFLFDGILLYKKSLSNEILKINKDYLHDDVKENIYNAKLKYRSYKMNIKTDIWYEEEKNLIDFNDNKKYECNSDKILYVYNLSNGDIIKDYKSEYNCNNLKEYLN